MSPRADLGVLEEKNKILAFTRDKTRDRKAHSRVHDTAYTIPAPIKIIQDDEYSFPASIKTHSLKP
jgi:hypothetical protein